MHLIIHFGCLFVLGFHTRSGFRLASEKESSELFLKPYLVEPPDNFSSTFDIVGQTETQNYLEEQSYKIEQCFPGKLGQLGTSLAGFGSRSDTPGSSQLTGS